MNVLIKDIPLNERPRERLINKGVKYLSNEELLAILLKTGTKDYSVKTLANNILKQLDNITDLKEINLETLIKIKGIGKAKACEILSAIELGKRLKQKIVFDATYFSISLSIVNFSLHFLSSFYLNNIYFSKVLFLSIIYQTY